ncbi:hypothetical protein FIBSPDRAFT_153232 [Athelia psychrophila]|uniref:Uncharacterized protein n=1 Tax=Athelia psychrophila TaxID=1759441 RepID=A0A166BHH1_9AGAM|nr:hypothetical protein FIBSPDRAFT_153232 [Fibularhizoctonia sp. CBS 109695]
MLRPALLGLGLFSARKSTGEIGKRSDGATGELTLVHRSTRGRAYRSLCRPACGHHISIWEEIVKTDMTKWTRLFSNLLAT